MTDEGDYELLPHEEIQKLRDELTKLKKNPLGSSVHATDLQSSVSELTIAINSLVTLLTQTNDDMVKEFQKTSISEHFAQISSQNEQIAQGILTIANMLQPSNTSANLESNSSFQESPVAVVPEDLPNLAPNSTIVQPSIAPQESIPNPQVTDSAQSQAQGLVQRSFPSSMPSAPETPSFRPSPKLESELQSHSSIESPNLDVPSIQNNPAGAISPPVEQIPSPVPPTLTDSIPVPNPPINESIPVPPVANNSMSPEPTSPDLPPLNPPGIQSQSSVGGQPSSLYNLKPKTSFPTLDIPPAPEKKKGGILGLFK